MQGLGWIAAIILGGLAGWVAASIMKAKTGLLANIGIGILGAVLANFLFGLVGISTSPTLLSQGVAGLVGACILIAVARALRRGR